MLVIQKDPSRPHGQGGQGTRHAARLAIDIEKSRVTLVKVKSPIRQGPDSPHPDGMSRRFRLDWAWKFVPLDDWIYADGQKPKRYTYGRKDEDFVPE